MSIISFGKLKKGVLINEIQEFVKDFNVFFDPEHDITNLFSFSKVLSGKQS